MNIKEHYRPFLKYIFLMIIPCIIISYYSSKYVTLVNLDAQIQQGLLDGALYGERLGELRMNCWISGGLFVIVTMLMLIAMMANGLIPNAMRFLGISTFYIGIMAAFQIIFAFSIKAGTAQEFFLFLLPAVMTAVGWLEFCLGFAIGKLRLHRQGSCSSS